MLRIERSIPSGLKLDRHAVHQNVTLLSIPVPVTQLPFPIGFGDLNINLPDGEDFAPDPKRVAELVEIMPPSTFHLGVPATDREHWNAIREHDIGRRILAEAREAVEADPCPHVTNEIYLECLEKNDPAPFNAVVPGTRSRMTLLVLSECLESTGEYLPIIEDDILRSSQLKSWTHPGNDTNRDTFEGRSTFNGLASVHLGSSLVAADYLLGDRLKPEIRSLIRDEVKRRVLDPFRQRIESGQDVYWWVTVNHNWNSVCVLFTTACALALLEDADDRAWYLAVAEKLIRYSEQGFEQSGFYTEGVSYWIYGFGCYLVLAEIVRAVTSGRIDWLSKPLVERMSGFGRRMLIQGNAYPSFADCRSDVKTPAWLDNWMNNRIVGSRTARATSATVDPFSGANFASLLSTLLVLSHQEDFRVVHEDEPSTGLREWFDDVQFLLCRPREDAEVRFASTFKGGHNGVNHNHNDLGVFSVLIGDRELLTDPGAEIYTQRTFSQNRYESDLLNSYGHPVPVVAGQLQSPGKDENRSGFGSEFCASVVDTTFSDEADRVVLDLKRAYRADTLETLTRTFTHFRSGSGEVEVVDEVAYSRPETFETALITYADWERTGDNTIRISQDGSAIDVEVTSDDGNLVMTSCVIEESSRPIRLAWHFANPVKSARVRFKIKPANLGT